MQRVRIRLGHIIYSNCFPVHARLIDDPRAGDPTIVEGVPSTLNGLLERGQIDVAPSSSIEYALHADRYCLFPDLVIGSRGPVQSILLLSNRAPEDLDDQLVALPDASATSVVLLKILLHLRWKVKPRFRWFDQRTEDPFQTGAAAALFIGDVALRPSLHPECAFRLDLGAEWWDETGLPFAFALWQTSSQGVSSELGELHANLIESRAFGAAHRSHLAEKYAPHFRMAPDALERYWGELAFDLDPTMLDGLARFYDLAAEIGEIKKSPPLRWIG